MPLFNEKHYQFLAKQLLSYKPRGEELEVYHRMLVYYLAGKLEADNPAFDSDKFANDCGIRLHGEGKGKD